MLAPTTTSEKDGAGISCSRPSTGGCSTSRKAGDGALGWWKALRGRQLRAMLDEGGHDVPGAGQVARDALEATEFSTERYEDYLYLTRDGVLARKRNLRAFIAAGFKGKRYREFLGPEHLVPFYRIAGCPKIYELITFEGLGGVSGLSGIP